MIPKTLGFGDFRRFCVLGLFVVLLVLVDLPVILCFCEL